RGETPEPQRPGGHETGDEHDREGREQCPPLRQPGHTHSGRARHGAADPRSILGMPAGRSLRACRGVPSTLGNGTRRRRTEVTVRTALIGYTGFVGSNLLDATGFDDLYNSKNIADIAGREYDLVVSAGNRADSHRINQDGAADLAEIDALVDTIQKARIGRLVLISTVCVYPWGGAPDEDTPLSPEGLTPYGANRLHQE